MDNSDLFLSYPRWGFPAFSVSPTRHEPSGTLNVWRADFYLHIDLLSTYFEESWRRFCFLELPFYETCGNK